MSPESLPLIGPVLRTGANDRLFDTLLLLGAPLLVVIALLGRQPITTLLAAGYVVLFLAHTVHNWTRTRRPPEGDHSRR